LEQPENDANLGQKKPSPAIEREISGSLTRRAILEAFSAYGSKGFQYR
jgi:hypothetical protein